MARKHNRKGSKVPVEKILVTPEGPVERKVKQNPETGDYEVVHESTPAVYRQGRALNSTIHRGKVNTGGVTAGVKKPKGGTR